MRPTEPLAFRPGGYAVLASYSSLGTFWRHLERARAAGRTVSPMRGDPPERCRRVLSGLTLPGAGLFVDPAKLEREAEHEPGLLPYAGLSGPELWAALGGAELSVSLTLGFTRERDLIVRPTLRLRGGPAELPLRRLRRDELGLMLERMGGG